MVVEENVERMISAFVFLRNKLKNIKH